MGFQTLVSSLGAVGGFAKFHRVSGFTRKGAILPTLWFLQFLRLFLQTERSWVHGMFIEFRATLILPLKNSKQSVNKI